MYAFLRQLPTVANGYERLPSAPRGFSAQRRAHEADRNVVCAARDARLSHVDAQEAASPPKFHPLRAVAHKLRAHLSFLRNACWAWLPGLWPCSVPRSLRSCPVLARGPLLSEGKGAPARSTLARATATHRLVAAVSTPFPLRGVRGFAPNGITPPTSLRSKLGSSTRRRPHQVAAWTGASPPRVPFLGPTPYGRKWPSGCARGSPGGRLREASDQGTRPA